MVLDYIRELNVIIYLGKFAGQLDLAGIHQEVTLTSNSVSRLRILHIVCFLFQIVESTMLYDIILGEKNLQKTHCIYFNRILIGVSQIYWRNSCDICMLISTLAMNDSRVLTMHVTIRDCQTVGLTFVRMHFR